MHVGWERVPERVWRVVPAKPLKVLRPNHMPSDRRRRFGILAIWGHLHAGSQETWPRCENGMALILRHNHQSSRGETVSGTRCKELIVVLHDHHRQHQI